MPGTQVQELASIGTMTGGDKLVGERVTGTTVRITFPSDIIYDTDFPADGFCYRLNEGQYGNRTLTGTSNRLTVTNGNGSGGNPVFDISTSYVGQATITTLGTVTTGTWNATVLGLTYGGTGAALTASNGGIVYSNASTLAVLSGTATASKVLMSGASTAPTWSVPTFPNGSFTSRKIIISDGTNWVASTETYALPGASGRVMQSNGTNWTSSTAKLPTTSGTALHYLISDGTDWVTSTAAMSDTPGTAGKVLVSDGTNWITSTPTFPNSSATTRKIIVSDGTNWTASTETYAVPGTSGKVMQSDGTNWTSATPTGTGTPVLATSPTLVTPVLGAATATTLAFSPTTGGIIGTTTNDDANAGNQGEMISSTLLLASTISLTTNVVVDIVSISLTAGDWDVWGCGVFVTGATTNISDARICISNVSATFKTVGGTTYPATIQQFTPYVPGSTTFCFGTGTVGRISLASTTTIYLVARGTFTVSTLSAHGSIQARRRR